jgi:hypothetical protein
METVSDKIRQKTAVGKKFEIFQSAEGIKTATALNF